MSFYTVSHGKYDRGYSDGINSIDIVGCCTPEKLRCSTTLIGWVFHCNRMAWLSLTLKWPRYFYSRWCPRGGGVPWNPPWENHFSTGILQWNLHHIRTGYKKSQSCKKKSKCCSVSKWRPNNRFLFRVISILPKFWKTPFPKEFFNEIWLKEGEYE